jgi:hypothetical protein
MAGVEDELDLWAWGFWAPGRRGDEGGCLEERSRRHGGLEEEAEGGGGGPSPAADEELQRVRRSTRSCAASLSPYMDGGMVDWSARQP